MIKYVLLALFLMAGIMQTQAHVKPVHQGNKKQAIAHLHKLSHISVTVTCYWRNSDHWTRRLQSASGVKLRDGVCAVDPRVIPYGSTVNLKGWGKFLAVDTGSDVISRTASHRRGLSCPVIDIFFYEESDALRAADQRPAITCACVN